MQHNHALKVTAGGTGLAGHAGAVLLRKAADQAGLTGLLSGTLRKKGALPAFDRGAVWLRRSGPSGCRGSPSAGGVRPGLGAAAGSGCQACSWTQPAS
jgi:hypothetical protein